jgi:hypothetical protein
VKNKLLKFPFCKNPQTASYETLSLCRFLRNGISYFSPVPNKKTLLQVLDSTQCLQIQRFVICTLFGIGSQVVDFEISIPILATFKIDFYIFVTALPV